MSAELSMKKFYNPGVRSALKPMLVTVDSLEFKSWLTHCYT